MSGCDGVGRSQLEEIMNLYQTEKAEYQKAKADQSAAARQRREGLKTESLSLTQEAQGLRGEAANIKATCNAIASGLAVAAACVATIPGFGAALAAVLL